MITHLFIKPAYFFLFFVQSVYIVTKLGKKEFKASGAITRKLEKLLLFLLRVAKLLVSTDGGTFHRAKYHIVQAVCTGKIDNRDLAFTKLKLKWLQKIKIKKIPKQTNELCIF